MGRHKKIKKYVHSLNPEMGETALLDVVLGMVVVLSVVVLVLSRVKCCFASGKTPENLLAVFPVLSPLTWSCALLPNMQPLDGDFSRPLS